jgi:hypothetical protein
MTSPRELSITVSSGNQKQRTIIRGKPVPGVVETIADFRNTDPTNLEPIYDVVDPDALNNLFQSSQRYETADIEVRFRYAGYDVSISDTVDTSREHFQNHSEKN